MIRLLLHRFSQYNGSVTCSEVLLCGIAWKSDKWLSRRYYVTEGQTCMVNTQVFFFYVQVPIHVESSNSFHHACSLVSLHILARLPLDSISWNLILESLIKLCCENWKFVTIGKNYQELHMKIYVHFIIAGDINSP
jgi:hypothetical protein